MRVPIVWQGIAFGLLTGFCWAVSPVLFRLGYAETPSLFVAVIVSLTAGAITSWIVWLIMHGREKGKVLSLGVMPLRSRVYWAWQVAAGVAVGVAVFTRWAALVQLSIVAVTSINMLNVPIVVIFAPLLLGQRLERTDWRLWLGTACILTGVMLTTVGGM